MIPGHGLPRPGGYESPRPSRKGAGLQSAIVLPPGSSQTHHGLPTPPWTPHSGGLGVGHEFGQSADPENVSRGSPLVFSRSPYWSPGEHQQRSPQYWSPASGGGSYGGTRFSHSVAGSPYTGSAIHGTAGVGAPHRMTEGQPGSPAGSALPPMRQESRDPDVVRKRALTNAMSPNASSDHSRSAFVNNNSHSGSFTGGSTFPTSARALGPVQLPASSMSLQHSDRHSAVEENPGNLRPSPFASSHGSLRLTTSKSPKGIEFTKNELTSSSGSRTSPYFDREEAGPNYERWVPPSTTSESVSTSPVNPYRRRGSVSKQSLSSASETHRGSANALAGWDSVSSPSSTFSEAPLLQPIPLSSPDNTGSSSAINSPAEMNMQLIPAMGAPPDVGFAAPSGTKTRTPRELHLHEAEHNAAIATEKRRQAQEVVNEHIRMQRNAEEEGGHEKVLLILRGDEMMQLAPSRKIADRSPHGHPSISTKDEQVGSRKSAFGTSSSMVKRVERADSGGQKLASSREPTEAQQKALAMHAFQQDLTSRFKEQRK